VEGVLVTRLIQGVLIRAAASTPTLGADERGLNWLNIAERIPMICFFLLSIALLSHNMDALARVPTRPETSTGTQSKQNAPATTCDVKSHLADFAIAVQLAMRSLDEETYLDQHVPAIKLPESIESISILDDKGKVKDSTIGELIGKSYALPSSGKTKEGEYYIWFKSTLGVGWILIKTKPE
jgi:hypothetical protein